MIQKHIEGDPRFNNMMDFIKFSVLNQIDRDRINGIKNYQPPKSGEERTIQGGSGSGKTQPNMDEKGGEIPGRKL